MNLFITGATGCIGHYVVEQLLQKHPDWDLHLMVRDRSRLKVALHPHNRVHFHQGSMDKIEDLKSVLFEMDYLIHIATEWGDYEHTVHINVDKTWEMFGYLNPQRLKHIIYFSTASILGPGNKVISEARDFGTPYIRSKFLAHERLQTHPLWDRIITLFPSTVFGGDPTHPFSHLSDGIPKSSRYLKILRWFSLKAAFHFLHGRDIATVTVALLTEPQPEKHVVLGQSVVTFDEAITVLCRHANLRRGLHVRIPIPLIFLITWLFRIHLTPWDRYCIANPWFEYQTTCPENVGQGSAFKTFDALITETMRQQRVPTPL